MNERGIFSIFYPLSFIVTLCLTFFFTTHSRVLSVEDLSSVERFVQHTADSVLAVVKSEVSDEQKAAELEKIFLKVASVDWMAKFALAKNLRSLSDTDKEKYITAYREFLLKSYVPKFRNYNGQHFKIISSKALGNSQFIVTTEIIDTHTSNNIAVAYRCRIFNDGSLKVIDIIAENVSLMASQRSEFSSIIENEGINSLISRLNAHIIKE